MCLWIYKITNIISSQLYNIQFYLQKNPTDTQISLLSHVRMHFVFHCSTKIYVGPLYSEILSTHKSRGDLKMQMLTSSIFFKAVIL